MPSQSPHYIDAVTHMSDNRSVVVQDDIYHATGSKLLAKGACIRGGSNRVRHILHKLLMPLDSICVAE